MSLCEVGPRYRLVTTRKKYLLTHIEAYWRDGRTNSDIPRVFCLGNGVGAWSIMAA